MIPFEIIQQVIQQLDPFGDGRQSLITCLRASRTCWFIAAKVLYRHVVLSRKRLEALLAGYKSWKGMSSRAVTVFGFINHFTIVGGVGAALVPLLHMAAKVGGRDGAALFPNVRQLSLRHAPWHIVTRGGRDNVPQRLPRHGKAVLFDQLNVCVEDELGPSDLPHLPVRGYRNVCFHTLRATNPLRGGLPPYHWDQLDIFARLPFQERLYFEDDRQRLGHRRTVSILFNTSITPNDSPSPPQTKKTLSIVRLRWFDADQMDDCPHCAVCGEWTG